MSWHKVIAVDFDGTIVQHRFPEIGEPMPGAFEVLKELQQAEFKLILWTCREDDGHLIDQQYLTDAVEFCKKNGVEFDAINETVEDYEFRHEGMLRRKPCAHYYVDDAIVGGFPGWDAVREHLLGGKDGNKTDQTSSPRDAVESGE